MFFPFAVCVPIDSNKLCVFSVFEVPQCHSSMTATHACEDWTLLYDSLKWLPTWALEANYMKYILSLVEDISFLQGAISDSHPIPINRYGEPRTSLSRHCICIVNIRLEDLMLYLNISLSSGGILARIWYCTIYRPDLTEARAPAVRFGCLLSTSPIA